jgi:hypothetical protein
MLMRPSTCNSTRIFRSTASRAEIGISHLFFS